LPDPGSRAGTTDRPPVVGLEGDGLLGTGPERRRSTWPRASARGHVVKSALCNGVTTFTVYSWRNLLRGYVTHGVDSTRQEAEGVAARAGVSKSPRIMAPAWPSVLTATRDGRHGRPRTSRPGRLLPLPPGRQTLPSHLPTRRMAGPATCPANTCRPGPLPGFWRDRSQHSGCPPQAPRGRCRPSPATWPACQLTWKAGDRVWLGSSWVVRQMVSDAGPG